MKVTVFGASGKVGQLVVKRLTENGEDITVFVFGTSPFAESGQLKVVNGDVHNLDEVRQALAECEIVVSTLGSWGTKSKDILSSGMKNIITAMQENGIMRIISLTGAEAKTPEEKAGFVSDLLRLMIKLTPVRKILADGEKHLELLHNSQLDWTVIRSPLMNTRGNPKQSSLSLEKPKPWATIHRQSVADSMVELLANEKFYKAAPFIIRKK